MANTNGGDGAAAEAAATDPQTAEGTKPAKKPAAKAKPAKKTAAKKPERPKRELTPERVICSVTGCGKKSARRIVEGLSDADRAKLVQLYRDRLSDQIRTLVGRRAKGDAKSG